jgi:prolyl-tRNA synthetase
MGSRMKDALLLGTPYLAIFGDRAKRGEVEIESTRTGQRIVIPVQDILAVGNKKCIEFESETR